MLSILSGTSEPSNEALVAPARRRYVELVRSALFLELEQRARAAFEVEALVAQTALAGEAQCRLSVARARSESMVSATSVLAGGST